MKNLMFSNKLKRGTGKYKGKLPFKCSECGEVGHFSLKCPNKRIEKEGKKKDVKSKDKTQKFRKSKAQKRSYYSKESDISEECSEKYSSE